MPSSFAGSTLFSSGPHRFHEEPRGVQTIPNTRLNTFSPGNQAIGPLESAVTIRGRLVAASESALWTLRDAIAAKLTYPPTRATLTDNAGRSWPDMDFVTFTPADRTDRNRQFSLTYEARFVHLTG